VIIVGGVHAGDVDQGLAEMQPLRELGTVLFDMSGPTPFVGVQTGFDPLFPRGEQRAYWKSQYVDELSDAAIDVIVQRAKTRPAPLTMVNTFRMGGAIADVDEEATAFSERKPEYMVSIDGVWTDAADDTECVAWIRACWDEVSEFGTGAVYLNFTGLADEAPSAGVESAFGRNLSRLAEIKRIYDPENVLDLNNNIKPAS
jgi:Berberine and berberine like